MSKLKSFIKNWALPLSMCVGIISYLVYHFTPALYPAGPFLHEAAVRMQPVLIFFMLFFQFAKVSKPEWILLRCACKNIYKSFDFWLSFKFC